MKLVASAIAIASLVACRSAARPEPANGSSPANDGATSDDATSSSGCDAGLLSQDVAFPATDGLVVHATAANPCGAAPRPVVVLAHQMCTDRSEWSQPTHDWVDALHAQGIATLAIDLRGHGASKVWPDGATHDLCAEINDPNVQPLYLAMVGDVQGAVAYARGAMHASSVATIGASIGANSSIVTFAADASIAITVALSPGLDYRGIQTEPAIKTTGARPVLLEAAEDDSRSASAVRQLAQDNPAVTTKVWPSGGHGNKIIDAHPEELARVLGLVVGAL